MGAIGLDWPSDQQLFHVWSLIDKMPEQTRLVISDFAKNKPDMFLKCCKMYIDCFPLKAQLSNDYKQVIKCQELI